MTYVVAPAYKQAEYWADQVGLRRSQWQYAGTHFENLRGLEWGTTIYRVGGNLSPSQLDAFNGWVSGRFNVVGGLPEDSL